MEKVMCMKCGSVGYTASPEQVNCSECGGKHTTIRDGTRGWKPDKSNRILSQLCARSG